MANLFLFVVLLAATFPLVRPAKAAGPRPNFVAFDGSDVLKVFGAVIVTAAFFGIPFALALAGATFVKELGHWVGHRLAERRMAKRRFLSQPHTAPGADRASADDLAAFFVLLMGPGVGLAPMVAAFGLATALAGSAPDIANAAYAYAIAASVLNVIALLPFWPLPGGRLARLVIKARFPNVGGLSAAAFAAFAVGLGVTWSSALLFLLGLLAALTLAVLPGRASTGDRPRLTRAQAHIGFTAYFATLGAYFLAGWWVLKLLPLGL